MIDRPPAFVEKGLDPPLSELIEIALLEVGMTDQEVRAMSLTVDCANAILELPVLHPMEKEEFCHAMHIIQDQLMARPSMRAMQGTDPDHDGHATDG